MRFKQWLLTEMPHLMVSGNLTFSCPVLIDAGAVSCLSERKVRLIDMRFELYPKGSFNWNSLAATDSKFAAPIPDKDEYLIKDNEVKILSGAVAREQGKIAPKVGEASPEGYVLLPDDWLTYATLIDQNFDLIK